MYDMILLLLEADGFPLILDFVMNSKIKNTLMVLAF